MRMSCADAITNFLADYVEGKLPPHTLADFEHHLDVCPSCIAYLRSYRQTIAMTKVAAREQRVEDVPEELVQAVLRTMQG